MVEGFELNMRILFIYDEIDIWLYYDNIEKCMQLFFDNDTSHLGLHKVLQFRDQVFKSLVLPQINKFGHCIISHIHHCNNLCMIICRNDLNLRIWTSIYTFIKKNILKSPRKYLLLVNENVLSSSNILANICFCYMV